LGGGFREGNIRPFELILQWSFFFIYIAYTLCGALFHYVMPVKFNKPFRFLEITRILKGLFYPVYYMAFLTLWGFMAGYDHLTFIGRISIAGILLGFAYCVWVYLDHFETSTLDRESFEVMKWIKENTPEGSCFHTISYEKPLFGRPEPETSTLPFWIRTIGERPVTFSYKDSPLKPNFALAWYERKKSIAAVINKKDSFNFFDQARKYQADYLLISNSLLEENGVRLYKQVKAFSKLSIFKIEHEGPQL
jgi:hypothetical protein